MYQQQSLQQQSVQLQEIKYTVQQDFLNVIGIAQQVQETLNYFKDEPDHPLIAIQMNRLIFQYNLSNAIHFDTNETAKVEQNENHLRKVKAQIQQLLNTLTNQTDFDQRILNILKQYEQFNLSPQPILKQAVLIPTQQQSKFNQTVVQKVFDGMSETGAIYGDIRNGIRKENDLNMNQVQQLLKNKSDDARQKLQANWAKQSQSSGWGNYWYFLFLIIPLIYFSKDRFKLF